MAGRISWVVRGIIVSAVALSQTGCFSTPPQIASLEPQQGSTDVPADQAIVVRFDQPVSQDSVIGHFTVAPALAHCDMNSAFHASPPAPCSIRWLSPNAFAFDHEGALFAPHTRYEVKLTAGIMGQNGAANGLDHTWAVTSVEAPTVIHVDPGSSLDGVSLDTALVVTFSRPMDANTTLHAISTSPTLPGMRIIQDHDNLSIFAIFPGHLLTPSTTYTVTVAATARDTHQQELAKSSKSVFTTGKTLGGNDFLVEMARRGEAATTVALGTETAATPGTSLPLFTLLEAPLCTDAHCGLVAQGNPLLTYHGAALSRSGHWLAVVIQDATVDPAPSTLAFINTETLRVIRSFAGGSMPSWSADSHTAAFVTGSTVTLYSPDSDSVATYNGGDILTAPPVWRSDGELIALSTLDSHQSPTIALLAPTLNARFAVPGIHQPATAPVFSADGSWLAFASTNSQGKVAIAVTSAGTAGTAAATYLTATGVPLGFSDAHTLFVTSAGAPPTLSRIDVNDNRVEPVSLPAHATACAEDLSNHLVACIVTTDSGTRIAVESMIGNGTPVFSTPVSGSGALLPLSLSLST